MARNEPPRNSAPVQNETPPVDEFASWTPTGAPDIDAWAKLTDVGDQVVGTLVGRLEVEDRDRKIRQVVLVKLARPCRAQVGKGSEKRMVDAAPGQVVGMGLKAKMSELWDYAEGTKLVVRLKEKIDIGGGQTMWKLDSLVQPGAKKRPPEERANVARAPDSRVEDELDPRSLPF